MDITPAQRRTLVGLIGVGPPPGYDVGLAERVREDLERRLAGTGVGRGAGPEIWVGKHRLNDLDRCEGLFEAGLLGERPAFQHTARTAAGALFHKAIELDVASERAIDPRTLAAAATVRLAADERFAAYWDRLELIQRAELEVAVGRRLGLFRDSFPPIPRRWAPQPELRFRVVLAGGRVVMSGDPDLVLGRRRRLAIDFKTGRAWPEHPEDMRFYSLLILLRTGVPPYRVATFLLDSGEWQAEDVDGGTIARAADRLVEAVASAVRCRGGAAARLTPGPYCRWCPRVDDCPAHAAVAAGVA